MTYPVAVVDEPLDRVGDLELAAGRRLDRAHGLVDGGGRTGRHRRARGRKAERPASRPSATTDPSGPSSATPNRSGSGTWASRICATGRRAPSGHRAAGRRVCLEPFDEPGETVAQQVVAEIHDEVVVTQEVAGDEHAVGQAERRLLLQVGDRQAPVASRHPPRPGSRRRCRRPRCRPPRCRPRPCPRDRRTGSACSPPAPAAWPRCG